jgi:predicted dehydrogenase
MQNHVIKPVLLIGTGQMAMDYTKVLSEIEVDFTVIGRGAKSALKYKDVTKISAITGGIEKYLRENPLSTKTDIIIAVGPEVLMDVLLLFKNDKMAERILIEKPSAISIDLLLSHANELGDLLSKSIVAYNRRFYASTQTAETLINEDGGLTSMNFEFTEWAHKIGPSLKSKGIKENWFFANSTHVVDLAFFLVGKPKIWQAYSKDGNLNWHKKSIFVGAGISELDIPFSYQANWESAGRWSVELLTNKRRIFMRPMEKLFTQNVGSINIDEYIFDDSIDQEFKPGLYKQTESFLKNTQATRLLTLQEHIQNTKEIYAKMIH